jgi:hypothetical protein
MSASSHPRGDHQYEGAQSSLLPFQRGQAHDVQTGDALPPLSAVHLTALSPPRALDLVLVPLLIVVPDLRNGERLGSILLVRQKEERDAKDLWSGEDGIYSPSQVVVFSYWLVALRGNVPKTSQPSLRRSWSTASMT